MMNRNCRRTYTLFIITTLYGCTASGPLPSPSESSSAIEFAESLVAKTTANNLDRLIDTVDNGEEPGYRWLQGWWCPRHEAVFDANTVRAEFDKFCHAYDGEISTGVCEQNDNKELLFYIEVKPGNECSGGPTAKIRVIEPSSGSNNADYLAVLRKYGYKTESERARDVADAIARRASREREAAKTAEIRDTPLHTLPRGTRICRAGEFSYAVSAISRRTSQGTLIAQLEEISEDQSKLKFRILVGEIDRLRNRYEPPPIDTPRLGELTIQPGITYWDNLKDWYYCPS